MALLSEKIEQGISETISQWYETELNAAFANTSAKIHMAADTGGGCSAIVIENISGSGLDIVITQEASAPYLANGETCNIAVSLYPHFFFYCGENAIQDMTIKAFEEHENALQYVCDLRDMALEIVKLNGQKISYSENPLFRVDWVSGYGDIPHKIMRFSEFLNRADGWDLDDEFLTTLRNSTIGARNSWAAMGEQIDFTKIAGGKNE